MWLGLAPVPWERARRCRSQDGSVIVSSQGRHQCRLYFTAPPHPRHNTQQRGLFPSLASSHNSLSFPPSTTATPRLTQPFTSPSTAASRPIQLLLRHQMLHYGPAGFQYVITNCSIMTHSASIKSSSTAIPRPIFVPLRPHQLKHKTCPGSNTSSQLQHHDPSGFNFVIIT